MKIETDDIDLLKQQVSKSKVNSNYFIVRLKVDQRAGRLSLPHLGIFAIHMRYFFVFF